jgi:flagellar hook-associated protein 1 FlgK
MSDLLALGSNGVLAYQRALVTVSNNISNVATEGYSRQEVELESLLPKPVGNDYIGAGVSVSQVRRQYDAFVESNLRGSISNWVGQGPLVQYANRVIDLMAGDQTSLTNAMTRFFESARALTVSPASSIVRASFLGEANALSAAFRQLHSQLEAVDQESLASLDAATAQANTITEQIALVNKQLQKKNLETLQPPELLDQRDRLLRDLSQLMKVTTSFSINGEVQVGVYSNFSQGVLVDRNAARRLEVATDPVTGRIDIQLGLQSRRETVTGLSGGEIGGLLAFREQVMTPSRDRLNDVARSLVAAVNRVHRSGIDALGRPGTDLLAIAPGLSAAEGMQVALEDPRAIVAASAFRANANALNVGTAVATVSYTQPALSEPPLATTLFSSQGLESTPIPFEVSLGTRPLTQIPAGLANPTVWIDPQDGQWPQLVTRDGRHLLGTALNDAQRTALMSSEGMTPGATYSDAYLNPDNAATAYLKADYFLGALAQGELSPVYDPVTGEQVGNQRTPAVLQTASMDTLWPAGLAAGAIELNGIALPALATPTRSQELADWINSVEAQTGVRAEATSEVRLPADRIFINNRVGSLLTLSSTGMGTVNLVTPAGGYASVDDLAAAINAQEATSGVWALVSPFGDLVLSGAGTAHITIGGDLLQASGTFGGQLKLTATDAQTEIRLGLGTGGTPSDLERLGLRTGLYWRGTAPEDLLVFVTGNGQAQVSAAYKQPEFDERQALREAPFEVRFITPDRYTLTDLTTGTVLADRPFDPHDPDASIDYRGLSVQLSRMPHAGDRFVIDGNDNGVGDNSIMIALADLESAGLMPSGQTLHEGYAQQSSRVGNVARQAGIAQSALEVVYQQAVQARDQVAGVSLDEEAADLIRFQQAYQASAKIMQTATSLIDTLLELR